MGITPITNLMPLSLTRSIKADLEPQPMERVENSARTGDETYSPSGQASGRGAEDDGPEDEAQQDEYQGSADEEQQFPLRQPAATAPASEISFFA